MSTQESKKSVPIYFYYLTISKQKGSKDESIYDILKVIDSLSNMFTYVIGKDLTERKKDNKASEKVIWLDSVKDLKGGNYDLIFKSAKYNHVRNEIDTETMKELGTRKRQQDGDEEKTHLPAEKEHCKIAKVPHLCNVATLQVAALFFFG